MTTQNTALLRLKAKFDSKELDFLTTFEIETKSENYDYSEAEKWLASLTEEKALCLLKEYFPSTQNKYTNPMSKAEEIKSLEAILLNEFVPEAAKKEIRLKLAELTKKTPVEQLIEIAQIEDLDDMTKGFETFLKNYGKVEGKGGKGKGSRKTLTDVDKALIEKMLREEDHTAKEIADEVGCSVPTVSKLKNELGLTKPKKSKK